MVLIDAWPLKPDGFPVIMERLFPPNGSKVEVLEVTAVDCETHGCRFLVECREVGQPL